MKKYILAVLTGITLLLAGCAIPVSTAGTPTAEAPSVTTPPSEPTETYEAPSMAEQMEDWRDENMPVYRKVARHMGAAETTIANGDVYGTASHWERAALGMQEFSTSPDNGRVSDLLYKAGEYDLLAAEAIRNGDFTSAKFYMEEGTRYIKKATARIQNYGLDY